MPTLEERIAQLPLWSGSVTLETLEGGITNTNFLVTDDSQRYVVRVGEDIPVHGVMRFNERAASRAAFACGLSPEVLHTAPGIMVLRFIEGKTLQASDLQQRPTLERALALLQRCHTQMQSTLHGPLLAFWVFYVLRQYATQLEEDKSRMCPALPQIREEIAQLEACIGPVQLTFCHNDLLAANFIDDGQRLWLLDWDYAGFNTPLFDLSNLSANNELDEADERWLLEHYYQTPCTPQQWHRYHAMKCASLLREAMWSMISEHHSSIDFDYVAYTDENYTRYQHALTSFRQL